jgi:ribosome-binding protein aMBF1 (putative translation factor)
MKRTKKKTSDAVKILDQMMSKDKKVQKLVAEARINAEVAQLIFTSRRKAALSQKQLAALVGTTQSVIARLEDADYEGHSLSMLQRIAQALDRRLKIEFTIAA